MQSGKSPPGTVLQIVRPAWGEPGCIKTDDGIAERQKLENRAM